MPVVAEEIADLKVGGVRKSQRNSPKPEKQDPNFQVGALVECHWQNTHDKFPGLITKFYGNGRYRIKHVVIHNSDDGTSVGWDGMFLQWDYNQEGKIDISENVHFDDEEQSFERKNGIWLVNDRKWKESEVQKQSKEQSPKTSKIKMVHHRD
jgi:hypothetical protein